MRLSVRIWEVQMGDGRRTVTLTLTEAQYDTFVAAAHQAEEVWKTLGIARSRNRQTLLRAMDQFGEAWKSGKRA